VIVNVNVRCGMVRMSKRKQWSRAVVPYMRSPGNTKWMMKQQTPCLRHMRVGWGTKASQSVQGMNVEKRDQGKLVGQAARNTTKVSGPSAADRRIWEVNGLHVSKSDWPDSDEWKMRKVVKPIGRRTSGRYFGVVVGDDLGLR
jgi:hypothetical protein